MVNVLLLLIIPYPFVCGILKIENKTVTHCVAEEDSNAAIFISPPIEEIKDSVNLIEKDYWLNDDWNIVNSTSLIKAAVLDRRWNDFTFAINKTDYFKFELKNSLSVSLYEPKHLEFFISNGLELDYSFFRGSVGKWDSFTFAIKSKNFLVLKNNETVKLIKNFTPNQIVIRSEHPTYWKTHNYKVKKANTVSTKNLTILTIPPSEKSYLVIYTSLCEECLLEINVSTTQGSRRPVFVSIHQNATEGEWQIRDFEINPNVTTNVTFTRKHNKGSDNGFWELDVRLYNYKDNIVAYRLSLEENNNYTCHLIKEVASINGKKKEKKTLEDCPNGKFGTNCQIQCGNVLGSLYPNCDKHRICTDSRCCCAWGYSGPFCENDCENGKWGLDCAKNCTGCISCDRVNGTCEETHLEKLPDSVEQCSLTIQSRKNLIISVYISHIRKNKKHRYEVIHPGNYKRQTYNMQGDSKKKVIVIKRDEVTQKILRDVNVNGNISITLKSQNADDSSIILEKLVGKCYLSCLPKGKCHIYRQPDMNKSPIAFSAHVLQTSLSIVLLLLFR